jgi:hypothetical protein
MGSKRLPFFATGVAKLGSDPNSAQRLDALHHRVPELGSDHNSAESLNLEFS